MVTALLDELNFSNNALFLSLREANSLAKGSVGPDTIAFDPSLTQTAPGTISLNLGEIQVPESLTIEGPGADR